MSKLSTFIASLSMAVVAAVFSLAGSRASAADTGFDPAFNGNVNAVAIQPDGKIIVAGSFTSLQPSRDRAPFLALRIARLNPDGSTDESFGTALDGEVMAVALQPDGRILVGGKFAHAQRSVGEPSVARNGLVRLERDGSIDSSFDPNPSGAPLSQAQVYALALQEDGKIVIGGGFTRLEPHRGGAMVTRTRLARLNADGSVDAGFDPRANNLVLALAVQRDGKVLVGGGFTTFQPSGTGEVIQRQRIARLNADGTPDSEFNPRANNRVLSLAVEPNGTILLGGDFTTLHPVDEELPTTRSHLARVGPDGRVLDGDFNPRPNATVNAILVQRDGAIVVGGAFTQFLAQESGNAVARAYLARLDRRGAVDASFAPGPNAIVNALALHDDGRIVVGGTFTRFHPPGATGGVLRHRLARVQPSGALDGSFATTVDGRVAAIAVQPEGQLLVGGSFWTFAGVTRANLARIRTDGTVDPDFHPDVNGPVTLMVPLADGKVLVSGAFTAIDGVPRNGFARLNRDGTVDTSYDPKPSGAITAVFVESDGRALVFGSFVSFLPNNAEESVSRSYVAWLNADGTVASGEVSCNGAINAVVRQPDGKYVIGGGFTSVAGTTRNYLARLNADLSLDAVFNPNVGGAVNALALQGDGKIVFAGAFTVVQQDDKQGDDDDGDEKKDDDADRQFLARVSGDGTLDLTFNPTPDASPETLLALPDGKLLVGGSFAYFKAGNTEPAAWRARLARLNADGTVDATFDLQANDRVSALVGTSDGGVFVGGSFTSLYGAAQGATAADNHVARLQASGAVDAAWRLRGPWMPGSRVDAIALQADGRMIVGGDFERLAGGFTTDLARFTADGALDGSFASGTDGRVRALLAHPRAVRDAYRGNAFAWLRANGSINTEFNLADAAQLQGRVNAIAVQADGAVIVGGYFQNRAGTTARELARFFPDGRLDPSFNPAPDATVTVLAVQPDGKILVAGAFTTIGGVARSRIARLWPDGNVDESFAPATSNGGINAIAVQPDGKIVIGGSFTAFDVDDGERDDDDFDGETNDDRGQRYLARLNADGTLDTAYRPEPSGRVNALTFRPDGKLVVGGEFATFQPHGAASATTRSGLAILNADGTLDDFAPDVGGTVSALLYQRDGKLLIGGTFSLVQLDDHEGDDDDGDGTTSDDADRTNLIRLNADQTLDAAFAPTPNGAVNTIFVQSDGRIVIGGAFTTLQPNGAEKATLRNFIARLHVDGALDTSFNPNANDVVHVLAGREDDSLLVGGAFTELRPEATIFVAGEFERLGDSDVPNLGRVNVDGSVDTGFRPAPNAAVHVLAVQSDGGVLAAGEFTRVGDVERQRLARFHEDGSLDELAATIDGPVTALAVLADDSMLIAGDFTRVNGVARSRLARLTATGALDASFAPPAVNGRIDALAVQAEGSVVIGGEFTRVGDVERLRVARLRGDGTLDPSFDPAADGPVETVALEAGGGIWVGGRFTRIGGVARARMARLLANGTVDRAIVADADEAVLTIVLNDEGRALVGGEFSLVSGQARTWLTRVDAQQASGQEVTVSADRSQVLWTRTGALPELAAVSVAVSTDRATWTTLGTARRDPATSAWTWMGQPIAAANTLYYVRLRGVLPSTRGATSGVLETVWQFFNSEAAGVGYPMVSRAMAVHAASANEGEVIAAEGGGEARATRSASSVMAAMEPVAMGEERGSATSQSAAVVRYGVFTSLKAGRDALAVRVNLEGESAAKVTLRASARELQAAGAAVVVAAPQLELESQNGETLTARAGAEGEAMLASVLAAGAHRVVARDELQAGGDVALTIDVAEASRAAARTSVRVEPRVEARVLALEIRGEGEARVILRVASVMEQGALEGELRVVAADGRRVETGSPARVDGAFVWNLSLPAGAYTAAFTGPAVIVEVRHGW